jgi:hypothetical protein
VIVHNLYVIGVSVIPDEADPIPVVDADAVLTLAIDWMSLADFLENSRLKTFSVSASANDLNMNG